MCSRLHTFDKYVQSNRRELHVCFHKYYSLILTWELLVFFQMHFKKELNVLCTRNLVTHFTLIYESRHFTDFKIFYSFNYFSKNDNVIALKLYLDFIDRHVIHVMRALTELFFFSILCTKGFQYLISIYTKLQCSGKWLGYEDLYN